MAEKFSERDHFRSEVVVALLGHIHPGGQHHPEVGRLLEHIRGAQLLIDLTDPNPIIEEIRHQLPQLADVTLRKDASIAERLAWRDLVIQERLNGSEFVGLATGLGMRMASPGNVPPRPTETFPMPSQELIDAWQHRIDTTPAQRERAQSIGIVTRVVPHTEDDTFRVTYEEPNDRQYLVIPKHTGIEPKVGDRVEVWLYRNSRRGIAIAGTDVYYLTADEYRQHEARLRTAHDSFQEQALKARGSSAQVLEADGSRLSGTVTQHYYGGCEFQDDASGALYHFSPPNDRLHDGFKSVVKGQHIDVWFSGEIDIPRPSATPGVVRSFVPAVRGIAIDNTVLFYRTAEEMQHDAATYKALNELCPSTDQIALVKSFERRVEAEFQVTAINEIGLSMN